MRAHELAARDGWTCWLCDGDVDPAAVAGSPWAPSVDHVVPRSRGGGNEPANLRLAHRRCNGRRGSSLPELDWPGDLHVVDAVPLWQALARLVRRPSSSELVAVLPSAELAAEAAEWVAERCTAVVGGRWAAAPEHLSGGLHAVRLAADPTDLPRSPGKPLARDARRGARGKRRVPNKGC